MAKISTDTILSKLTQSEIEFLVAEAIMWYNHEILSFDIDPDSDCFKDEAETVVNCLAADASLNMQRKEKGLEVDEIEVEDAKNVLWFP